MTHESRFLSSYKAITVTKEDKTDFIKMKNFCSSKDTIKKMNRQSIDLEETLAKRISDEGLLSRVCKELWHFNSRRQPIKNGQRFEESKVYMPEWPIRTMKEMLNITCYPKMQIKNHKETRSRHPPMAIVKETDPSHQWKWGWGT